MADRVALALHCAPMSYARCLRGLASGIEYPVDSPMNLDPVDGRPVEIVIDLERLAAERPRAAWYRPERRDLWRLGARLAHDAAAFARRLFVLPFPVGAPAAA